jgi:hypothetical protein
MTMPATGQPATGQPDSVQPDPNAQPNGEGDQQPAPKSAEEQLAELTEKLEDLKRHSRTWEQRAKENKAKADELDKIQAANATPDQRLQAAEERAAKAERKLVRYQIAAETGVPAALVHGDTEDEMREAAKAALEFRGAQPKPQAPKPDPSQGGSGGKSKVSAADEGRAEAQRRIAARSKKS